MKYIIMQYRVIPTKNRNKNKRRFGNIKAIGLKCNIINPNEIIENKMNAKAKIT